MRLVVEAEDFDEAVAFYRDTPGLREDSPSQAREACTGFWRAAERQTRPVS
jgi:catechol 2,3-dioxygenase-like lactoylglutathione lyase family enzyme